MSHPYDLGRYSLTLVKRKIKRQTGALSIDHNLGLFWIMLSLADLMTILHGETYNPVPSDIRKA